MTPERRFEISNLAHEKTHGIDTAKEIKLRNALEEVLSELVTVERKAAYWQREFYQAAGERFRDLPGIGREESNHA